MQFHRDQLATLATVVETGSFEAAARRLHVSQPAVSQRIKALEATVGRVLVRRTRPLQPTDAARSLLRHAAQLAELEAEIRDELGLADERDDHQAARPPLRVVVNADSMATWFLDVLVEADLEHGLNIEVLREDEHHASTHLRDGSVVAAVTAVPEPLRGCTTTRLGALRYLACASPEYAARHLSADPARQPTGADLAIAPVLRYDRHDELQSRFLRRAARRTPRGAHRYVPGSGEFRDAVIRGLGWGVLPERQCLDLLDSGDLVRLLPDHHLDVPLSWQTWRVAPAALERLTGSVVAVARRHLH